MPARKELTLEQVETNRNRRQTDKFNPGCHGLSWAYHPDKGTRLHMQLPEGYSEEAMPSLSPELSKIQPGEGRGKAFQTEEAP